MTHPHLSATHKARLDCLAQLAADGCDAQTGLIVLLKDGLAWCAAVSHGEHLPEIALQEWCRQSLRHGGLLVRNGAAENGVGFRAALPLIAKDGTALGMLAVEDDRAHQLSTAQADLLTLLGKLIAVALEDAATDSPAACAAEPAMTDFTQVFEASPHFQVLLDSAGRVVAASKSALTSVYDPEKVLAHPLWDAPWWPQDQALTRRLEKLFRQAASGQTVTTSCACMIGESCGHSQVTADFIMAPVHDPAGKADYVLVSGLGVADHARNRQFSAGLEDILKSIAAGAPVADILRNAIALAGSQLAPLSCSFVLVNPGGTHLQECMSTGLPTSITEELHDLKIEADTTICGRAIVEKRDIYIEDIATDTPRTQFRERLLYHGYRACWSIPFFSSAGRVLGALTFYAAHTRPPTAQEATRIHALANIMRIAIEREDAIKALFSSDSIVRATFAAFAAGIAVETTDGVYLRTNTAYCRTVGYSETELRDVRSWQLIHPDDRERYLDQIKQLVAGVFENFTTEKRHVKKNGDIAWMRCSVALLYQPDDMPPDLIIVTEDVTAEKMAEETLERTQSLLQIASRMAHIGGWTVSFPERSLVWSDEVAAIHEQPAGYTPALEGAFDHHAPEYRERMKAAFDDCASKGIAYDEESEIISGRGQRVWVRSTGEAIRDDKGRIIRIQGAVQDIGERKRTDMEKQRTLMRLQRIADRVPGLLCELELGPDGSMRMPYASEHIRSILRLSPQEVGRDASLLKQRVHPDDLPGLRTSITQSAEHLTLWAHEFRLLFEDGHFTWVRYEAMPYRDADGTVTWYGFLSDVSQSRKSQEHLKLLELGVSRLNDIVFITEAEPCNEPGPRCVFVNDAFERHTGYARDEIIGKSPRMLQGPKTQRSELDKIRGALEKSEPVRAELINYRKDGSEFWLELDIAPVADDTGWYTHWIAVERDITERKNAERELARLNRALTLRSALSKAIIHACEEDALLRSVCDLALDIGGYRSTWIGFAQDDADKTISPAACVGPVASYIHHIKVSWSPDVPAGQGPAGVTVRQGQPVVCENLLTSNYPGEWRGKSATLGLHGIISLPLRRKDKTLGVFVLFTSEVRAISREEVDLLLSLTDDLALAIVNLRAQKEQQRVQTAISRIAAGVSCMNECSVFAQITQNMASALNADAAFISRFLPRKPGKAMMLAGTVDGQLVDNFEYAIEDAPCNNLMQAEDCVIAADLGNGFPNCDALQCLGGKTYVGRTLHNNTGEAIGMIFLIFRRAVRDVDFIVSTLKIFTSRTTAELQRQESDSRIRQQASLIDKAQDAIIVSDLEHKVLYWNKSAERLYGWSAEEVIGTELDKLIYQESSRFQRNHNLVLKHGEWSGEIQQRTMDGRNIFVEARWTLVRADDGTPQSILAINTDITDRKSAHEEIQRLAFFDPLTGLPNRQLLIDRLRHGLTAYARNRKIGALLFIDLDNFKTLNDTLGHHVGDLLLKEVANRLSTCVRRLDTVARLGGDEFVIMLADLGSDIHDAVTHAGNVAQKVCSVVDAPYHVAGHEHFSSPSIGITLLDQRSPSSEEVLKQADLAMYQAKAAGRNTYRFYDEQMQSVVTNKVALEADLRQALVRNQLLLYYQPQVNSTGRVTGAEVLLRWQHPVRGIVSPAEFIPLAEETRMIISIGAWVIEQACSQLARWAEDSSTADLLLAVNVSAHQFRQPDFVKQVCALLDRTGIDPSRLKLELTESLLVDNINDVVEKMMALKAEGIGFSLDDFGTGYSSLSYLKQLPLEQLKIDRSFVRDVLTDPNDATIARTIVALGQSLGLDVIAEGVETKEQRAFLFENGCYVYQGSLFSKPLPLSEFGAYLAQHLAS